MISVCVIGVKFNRNENGEESSLELLILAPHVGNKIPGENIIYIVVLDDDRKQIEVLPKPWLMSGCLYFNYKPWIIYFPIFY